MFTRFFRAKLKLFCGASFAFHKLPLFNLQGTLLFSPAATTLKLYHTWFRLSTPFFKFFEKSFLNFRSLCAGYFLCQPPLGSGSHIILQTRAFVNTFFQKFFSFFQHPFFRPSTNVHPHFTFCLHFGVIIFPDPTYYMVIVVSSAILWYNHPVTQTVHPVRSRRNTLK